MWTGQASDPALIAAEDARKAERAFLSIPATTARDELNAEFIAAEARWEAADEAFADAVPTTLTGVLAKVRALEAMLVAMPVDDDSLELRHIRALVAYLENMLREAA